MAAPPAPFISVDELTDFIGTDADNPKGIMVTDAACDICRTVSEQTFTEVSNEAIVLDGSGTDTQLLPQYPVTSVSLVKEDGETLTSTDYVIDRNQGALVRVPNGQSYQGGDSPVWKQGRQNIAVTYKHGWAPVDLPTDIRMAALSIAKRLYQQPEGNIASESLGARSVSYREDVAADLDANENRILEKYKRY